MEGRYPLPNDEAEQTREEMKHAMVKELLGDRLIMAPIGDSPQKILDLGTGCGVWAIEGKFSPPIPSNTSHSPLILLSTTPPLIPLTPPGTFKHPWNVA